MQISPNNQLIRWLGPLLALLAWALPTTGFAQTSSASSGLSGFFKSAAQDDFLPPDEAFQVSVKSVRADQVEVHWVIAPDYYLYRKRFSFSAEGGTAQLGTPQFPQGEIKNDEFFGEMEVYHRAVTATVPIARATPDAVNLALKVTYQGCAEAGLCYSPIVKTLDIALPQASAASNLPSGGGAVAEQDRLALLLRDGNLAWVLATFFGLGVLLSFTPCVLPMVPILSGIIVGQGDRLTPARGFSLAFTYVQGMALTYAGAAVLFVSAFNQAPQAFFQKPWIIGTFAALFVVLALAMFGGLNIQLPSSLQTRLTQASNQQKTGTFVGTFVMGALSALVVTACVAPAIIAAMSVIAQTGAIARGAGALYAMGLGMGVPVMLVGASAGRLLPKAGPWMDTVKSLFGVLFLAVAIYLLQTLLPGVVSMALWAALAIIAGFWIFSLRTHGGNPAPAALRGAGLLILIYGVLLLIGAGAGRVDPLQPLQGLGTSSNAGDAAPETAAALPFRRIKTVADFDRELAAASGAGKPVMLDFYADWCVSCKEMEKYTFSKPQIRTALAGAVLLQADVTANDAEDRALLQRFGIFGPPTIAFFDAQGKERRNYRVVGYMTAEKFQEQISAAFGGQS